MGNIIFFITPPNIDSENAIVENIELNNRTIKLFTKENKIIVVWQEKNLLLVAASNLDRKIFLDIIAGIKNKKTF